MTYRACICQIYFTLESSSTHRCWYRIWGDLSHGVASTVMATWLCVVELHHVCSRHPLRGLQHAGVGNDESCVQLRRGRRVTIPAAWGHHWHWSRAAGTCTCSYTACHFVWRQLLIAHLTLVLQHLHEKRYNTCNFCCQIFFLNIHVHVQITIMFQVTCTCISKTRWYCTTRSTFYGYRIEYPAVHATWILYFFSCAYLSSCTSGCPSRVALASFSRCRLSGAFVMQSGKRNATVSLLLHVVHLYMHSCV